MFLTSRQRQHACVIVLVVLAHAFALWGLHQALHGKPLQVIVPARMLAELIVPAPPAPPVAAQVPEPLAQPGPLPVPMPSSQPTLPTLAVADATLTTLKPARTSPRPRPSSPLAPEASQPVPRQPQPEVAQAAPQLPEVVVRSSGQPSQASGSLNPVPLYPAASHHLREAGRVLVRVLAGPDGRVLDAVLQRSSGFDRLDQVALETLRHWRFDPAAYPSQSETQWLYVPIRFVAD